MTSQELFFSPIFSILHKHVLTLSQELNKTCLKVRLIQDEILQQWLALGEKVNPRIGTKNILFKPGAVICLLLGVHLQDRRLGPQN